MARTMVAVYFMVAVYSMVAVYCTLFRHVPERIFLDIDDTFDAVHGDQQLRLFKDRYDEYDLREGTHASLSPV